MAETAEKIVLTKEEIETLSQLQQQQNDLVFGLGQTEYQISFLNKQKDDIKTQLNEIEQTQRQSGQELEQKYGQGTINLESGEFVKA
jgi:hypothetical protein